jgi:hypothetical protein
MNTTLLHTLHTLVAQLAVKSRPESSVVTEYDLAGLPAPVQRYLTFSGVIGQPWIRTVRLSYSGRFRLGTGRLWMSIHADQFYTVSTPGFVWKARFRIAGLPLLSGLDTYKDGHSHMHGKLAGLFTVVEGSGEEVDQGTMVRYLQEMSWFPVAYLGANVSWTEVDDHAADVTLHDSGKSVTGRMYFDDDGRMLTFIARRYGDFNGKYAMHPWTTPTTEYACFGGLNIPAGGRGVWRLPTGDLPYIDVRLTDVAYNPSDE